MISNSPQLLFFAVLLIFASVVFMHLAKRSKTILYLYIIQSVVISALLLEFSIKEASFFLIASALVTFAVKTIIAPHFFNRLINKHQVRFTTSTYMNNPLTLTVLAVFVFIAYSKYFQPLTVLAEQNEKALLLTVATIFISLFLTIARKDALSQMMGILSLENGIVAFAFLSHLESGPALQLGVLFDVIVWVIIATVFSGMVYKQFGSLDISEMTHLQEE